MSDLHKVNERITSGRSTKYQLMSLLFSDRIPYVQIQGTTGILSSVQREDGSGHNYNVTINADGEMKTFFIKTVD